MIQFFFHFLRWFNYSHLNFARQAFEPAALRAKLLVAYYFGRMILNF